MDINRRGFTIIEVMLFLAISGLLLLGVFAFSSSLIGGSRFADSMRGLESFLQRKYDETGSGVNSRGNLDCASSVVNAGGTATPGTSNCLLLGKVLVFTSGSSNVDTYDVVGSEPASSSSSSLTLEELLWSYDPTTVPASRDSYSIPWEAEFTAGRRLGSSPANVNTVALLRSPNSSQIGVYHIPKTITASSAVTLRDTDIIAAAGDATASYCVQGRDRSTDRAAITFGRAQGSTAIDILFDFPGAPPC